MPELLTANEVRKVRYVAKAIAERHDLDDESGELIHDLLVALDTIDALRDSAPQPRVLWRGRVGQIAASLLGKKPSARGWDPDMQVVVMADTEVDG